MDAEYCDDEGDAAPVSMKTATAEWVETGGQCSLKASNEHDKKMRYSGCHAPVHKPLVAPGKVTGKGDDVLFSGDGGHIIHRDSQLHKEMRKAHEKLFRKYGYKGTTPLYKENGIYNLYVWKARPRDAADALQQAGEEESEGRDIQVGKKGKAVKPVSKPEPKQGIGCDAANTLQRPKAKPRSKSGNYRQAKP